MRAAPRAFRPLPSLSLLYVVFFFLAAFLSPPPAYPAAVAPDPATIEASAAPPLDPAIRTGRLDNGLTWYVRKNSRPEKRAELWLAVNAGSTLEDDDQRGLAHFVEHMAFNGTKHFKKHELTDYLERIGMRFGADINAYTSFDETVYTITVPTDDAAIVEKGLQILEDWSRAVTFDADEIEKERGVVVEEWRLGRGAEARMRDRQFPVLFKGSRYADRLTIGRKEILETASRETIRRYYRDWYRPDLMAVIAVGDFDEVSIEAGIRKHFSRLKNPGKERARTVFPIPGHDETLVAVATDPEATSTRVSINYKLPPRPVRTVGDYRLYFIDYLYHRILNGRLDELRTAPDPPFLSALSYSRDLVRSSSAVFQSATVEEKGLTRGLDALLVELARVDKHGFLQSELDRSKKSVNRSYERAYAERDKQESGRHADAILRHFLDGESLSDAGFELGLVRRFLPGISLEEVNGADRGWEGGRNRVILVNGPEKKDVVFPDEKAILTAFGSARAKPVDPWVDRVRDEPLVASSPEPATIVEQAEIASTGATKWRLSNGVTVILKPTDFKNDEIVLSGFSPGGTSVVPDAQFVSARLAAQILYEGGAGEFDKVQLQKALTGKIASVYGGLNELEETISGNASPQDIETMFDLIYLRFTAPRADDKAFQAWKTRTKGSLENRLARPETVFEDQMTFEMSQGHLRRRPLTVEILEEADLGIAESVWRDRFADAGDFTFVIVGAFKIEDIRPLVLTRLGGLPSAGRVESWKDVGVRAPKGVHAVEVRKGLEPKSQVRIVFTGDAPWSREQSYLMRSLGDALRIRLREILREDLGGVYGVGASGALSRRPREEYSFTLSFGCSPDRVDELGKAALDAVAAVKENGFGADVTEKVKEQHSRGQETNLKQNWFWLFELESAARYGEEPWRILDHERLVGLVTSDNLRDAARRYLDPDRRVVGVLYPEPRPAAPDAVKADPAPGG